MSQPHSTPTSGDRPEDFSGLHAELGELFSRLQPAADDLWPRLEDHRSRWELYAYGLEDDYEKLVALEIVDQLGSTLANLGNARERLRHALQKADDHSQGL